MTLGCPTALPSTVNFPEDGDGSQPAVAGRNEWQGGHLDVVPFAGPAADPQLGVRWLVLSEGANDR